MLKEQSVDESQWIATGATYLHGAIFWKTISGCTSGPLIYILPIVMSPLDGLNYTTFRLFGLLCCLLPTIYLLWRTLRLLFGELPARLTSIGAFLFYASINQSPYVAYNAERVVILFLAIGIYILFSSALTREYSKKKIVLFGIALGLIPYAKLQGAPFGLFIGALMLYEIAFRSSLRIKNKAVYISILIFAALIPSLILSIYLTVNHCWNDFFEDYILRNVKYVDLVISPDQKTGLAKATLFLTILLKNISFFRFILGQLLAILVILVLRFVLKSSKPFPRDRVFIWILLMLFMGFISVIEPGKTSPHYLFFFTIPYFLFIGWWISQLIDIKDTTRSKITYTGILYIPFIIYTAQIWFQPSQVYHEITHNKEYSISDVSKSIRKYSRPGERMSLWGFSAGTYLETGLLMCNKAPYSFYATLLSTTSQTTLNEYLAEMKMNKPVVFYDEVSHNEDVFFKDDKYRHEHYAGISDYIAKNYTEVGDFKGKRVYILNSRVREIDSTSSTK